MNATTPQLPAMRSGMFHASTWRDHDVCLQIGKTVIPIRAPIFVAGWITSNKRDAVVQWQSLN